MQKKTHAMRAVVSNLGFPHVYNSQKSWPAELVVKASGRFHPRISGETRLGITVLEEAESCISSGSPYTSLNAAPCSLRQSSKWLKNRAVLDRETKRFIVLTVPGWEPFLTSFKNMFPLHPTRQHYGKQKHLPILFVSLSQSA